MGNVVIASPALGEGGALTASAAAAGFPVSNLQKIQPRVIWRTPDLTDAWLEMDLGASSPINLVSLIGTNASAAATWRIRTAATQAGLTGGSPDYDSTVQLMWGAADLSTWDRVNAFNFIAAGAPTSRWVRIDLSDPTNTDGYIAAGRLVVSKAFQPTRNLGYGWSVGFEDDSEADTTDGGNTLVTPKGKRRVVDFELKWGTKADMLGEAFDIDRTRGTSRDIIVIPNPDSDTIHNEAIQGRMTNLSAISNDAYGIYKKRYQVTEFT